MKVRLQAETTVNYKNQMSAFSTARQLCDEGGFGSRGLYKGLTSTMGRHGVFGSVYFGFYHNVKNVLPQCEDPMLEFGRKFCLGWGSGTGMGGGPHWGYR